MKKLTDWTLAIILFLAILAVVAGTYEQPKPNPQLTEIRAELAEIKAAVGRTETTVGHVYDQQTHEVFMRDWRSK